jgi:hypothetical protein
MTGTILLRGHSPSRTQRLPRPTVGASPDAWNLIKRLDEVAAHWSITAHDRTPSVEHRFRVYADQWRRDTAFSSSIDAMALHPAYQHIIGMGISVVPCVLGELRDRGGYWYWALKAITGGDPVPASERGSIEAMRARWLTWGRESGMLGQ